MDDVTDQLSAERSGLIAMIGERALLLHGPSEEVADLSGSDLDCVVSGMDRLWPLRLPPGWRLCQCLRYDLGGWYWVLERGGEIVPFDTIDDPWGLGRDAIHTGSFFEIVDEEPASAVRAAYLTVKRVRKRNFASLEWERIGGLARQDPERFRRALTRLTGSPLAKMLERAALRGTAPGRNVVEVANVLRFFRRFGSPARIAMTVRLGISRYVERISHPAGFTILVAGPDGAGKSTLAHGLPELLKGPFKKHVVNHWRPGILPRPGVLVGRSVSDATAPHSRLPFGRIPSLALLAYYWADFVLGELVFTHRRIRTALIVCERGWWDLAVDPRRYRLDVPPRLVRALGSVLRKPDLAVVLSAPTETLLARKAEIDRSELERQTESWRSALPPRVPTLHVDTSIGTDATVDRVRETVFSILEARAVSRLGGGWASIPSIGTRWWIPRSPRGVAKSGISVYHPVTRKGRRGWGLARAAASLGLLHVLPRGSAPPPAVRHLLAPHVAARGTYAVARANHPDRYGALLLTADGAPHAYAKVALDAAGVEALDREGSAIASLGLLLEHPLRAPGVRARSPGVLVLEPIDWRPRAEPWVLPEEVAAALGSFFKAGSVEVDGALLGPAHGDCAPWNLLRTADGWSLVDWESAREESLPFHDLCHFLVQAHTLLGRPEASELLEGFRGEGGWIAGVVAAYADAAGVPATDAEHFLRAYLEGSTEGVRVRSRNEESGLARRRRLADALGS